jgi:prepilin-type N-terminal cleavage/methylation domain-containing protein
MNRSLTLQCSANFRPMRKSSERRGFTLIEVLVVIAIVSLLIAILLPSMAAARRSSRRTACQSNLRQIATAWQVYLDQADGYFPQWVTANLNFGGRQGKGLAAYGADTPVPKPLNGSFNLPDVLTEGGEIFKCPADEGAPEYKPTCFEYFGTSYQTNIMMIGPDQMQVLSNDPCKTVLRNINKRLKKLRRAKVSGDGKLILVGDIGWYTAYARADGEFMRIEWHGKPYTHNVAFMDTHVEFVRMRRGLHVTDDYCVVPFSDLAAQCQKEIPTP